MFGFLKENLDLDSVKKANPSLHRFVTSSKPWPKSKIIGIFVLITLILLILFVDFDPQCQEEFIVPKTVDFNQQAPRYLHIITPWEENTWLTNHPNYDVIEWTLSDLDIVLRLELGSEVLKLSTQYRLILSRLLILYLYGGIFPEHNSISVKSLEPMMQWGGLVFPLEKDGTSINTVFAISIPGHPALEKLFVQKTYLKSSSLDSILDLTSPNTFFLDPSYTTSVWTSSHCYNDFWCVKGKLPYVVKINNPHDL